VHVIKTVPEATCTSAPAGSYSELMFVLPVTVHRLFTLAVTLMSLEVVPCASAFPAAKRIAAATPSRMIRMVFKIMSPLPPGCCDARSDCMERAAPVRRVRATSTMWDDVRIRAGM
jgi:hypothetical protein